MLGNLINQKREGFLKGAGLVQVMHFIKKVLAESQWPYFLGKNIYRPSVPILIDSIGISLYVLREEIMSLEHKLDSSIIAYHLFKVFESSIIDRPKLINL